MAEYIEREAALKILEPYDGVGETWIEIDVVATGLHAIPAADVVSGTAFSQVMWERDVAIQQLREDYGVGLGEKRKRGRWIHRKTWDKWVCSECSSEEDRPRKHCPECGVRMDGGADNAAD